MRSAIYVAAVVAGAACAPETARTLLASAASACFEAAPYLAAGVLCARLCGGRLRALLPYAGCGCGRGPGARSIPAAVATALLFGPVVAGARVIAAALVARVGGTHPAHEHASLLDELAHVGPSAVLAASVLIALPATHVAHLPLAVQALGGAAVGFTASPCALGAVAVAGALHTQAPAAAFGFLCVAGIADLRVWRARRAPHGGDDAGAYLLVAIACAIVAWKHGAALVHPLLALPLAAVALYACIRACRTRGLPCTPARAVPACMLAAVVISAPAPQYGATETTLANAFAGERVDFSGALVRTNAGTALVRFAITCCRADAQPVAIALAQPPPFRSGCWLHGRGVLREVRGTLALAADTLVPIAPPADPFVYR